MSEDKISQESSSVQTHLNILQNIIQRMSSNSTYCKAWSITLISAILVIVADKDSPKYGLIALVPNLLFFILDSYYLSLEKHFRKEYIGFIKKLHNKEISKKNLFNLDNDKFEFSLFKKAILSISIWPFYLTLLIMILTLQYIIL